MTNLTNEMAAAEYLRRQQQLQLSNLEDNQPAKLNRRRVAMLRARANAHEQLIDTLEAIKEIAEPNERHQRSRELILKTLKEDSGLDEFCLQITSDVFMVVTLMDEEDLDEFMKVAPKAVAFIENYNRTPGTEHIAVDSFNANNALHVEAFTDAINDDFFSFELSNAQNLPFIHFPRHCWFDNVNILTPVEIAYNGAMAK